MTMVVQYSRSSAAVAEAVEKTFDGQHPCALCKSIEQSKQREKTHDVRVVIGKLNLFHQPAAVLVIGPGDSQEQKVSDTFAEVRTHAPPVPPPRDSLS